MDYVARAEKVINSIKDNRGNIRVTTTQLRKFLAIANLIDNEVKLCELRDEIKNDKLPDKIVNEILSMKVKLVYQAGREPNVKYFVDKSGLLKDIDNINGQASKFKDFFNYLEALTAYHKFEGGKK